VLLAPGARLGPYEIAELIGQGGMGEVYRAHDPRLRRDVAIKILRRTSTDAEHLARFTRETHAASSLNHPNIVAVFDVGTENGVPYVVTELLEGETLRARLNRGMLPYRKALEYAVQIAHALDAAHGKGIWHRDVKPANVFITAAGSIKLLDFGIAKLSEPLPGARPDDPTAEDTETGDVRGTAGYMAPEQIRGEPVDHRVDIFALGAVMYEMFTGARAFKRASSLETMTAILEEDPADLLTQSGNLSPMAAAVVRRCLEKNREERIQSARDLAFDLQQLRDVTAGTKPPAAARSRARSVIRPALLVTAGLVAGAGLALFALFRTPAPSFEQLTFHRGRIGGARFASEGTAVVYSEARRGNDLGVWRLDLADRPASRALGFPVGSDVLAARAGELALSLGRRFVLGERFVGTLAIAPVGGGSPREMAENVEDADWDATGGELAMVRSTADGQSQIEFPLGHVRYRTTGSLRFVRVSPDGRQLAFLEDPGGRGVSGWVAVLPLDGEVKKLTDVWESVRGVAWSPRGDEIWFTAGAARANRALRAVTLSGRQRLVLEAPGSLTLWDIAADGRVLLTRDEERRAVRGVAPGEAAERDLSWFDDSGVASISRDGRLILCGDRFGIYLRGTDGSDAISLLKDGYADDLSPDNRWALATADGQQTLVLIPTGAGDPKPRPLPKHDIDSYRGARWFPDGRRILFTGVDKAKGTRSYIQDITGGPPRPITPSNIRALAVSPLGDLVAAIAPEQGISLWPLDGGAPTPVKGSREGDRPVAWSDDGFFLWVFRRNEMPGEILRLDLRTGQRDVWKTLNPPDADGIYSIIDAQITPAGHAYAYTYTRLLSQLYLVQGLK
jgi:Tol biopolymer transport system component